MQNNVQRIWKESASSVLSKVVLFNKYAKEHIGSQEINPFSQQTIQSVIRKHLAKKDYGRPPTGSLSEARSREAQSRIWHEIVQLCEQIYANADTKHAVTGMQGITFGKLFELYNQISDKLVGVLLRARKYKCVQFEGEMLFQRRDENVVIYLIKDLNEIKCDFEAKFAALNAV